MHPLDTEQFIGPRTPRGRGRARTVSHRQPADTPNSLLPLNHAHLGRAGNGCRAVRLHEALLEPEETPHPSPFRPGPPAIDAFNA